MDVALAPSPDRSLENRFFLSMSLSMLAVVFVGFAPTFFLRPWFPEASALAAPEPIFYFHGILFAGWMVLLATQTSLVGAGQVRWHRRLGSVGISLAAAMVLTGVVASLVAAGRPGGFMGVPVPPLQFLAVPLFDIALFGTLVALAAVWRRDRQTHKRLMLLATANLLAAAVARIPLGIDPLMASFIGVDIFVVLLAGWDLGTLRRLHPATLWAGAATVVSQPLRLAVSDTQPWLAFAGWAVGMVE